MPATIERPPGLDIPETRHLAARFVDPPELRASDSADGSYTLIGHAAVFDRLSLDLGGFRERIQRGAFRSVLDDPNLDITLVVDHGMGVITTLASTRGGTLELSEDPRGLRVYASVAPTTAGRDTRILIERGDVRGMSFGFRVADGGEIWSVEDGVTIRTIRQMGALSDVSVVSFPAYPQTDVSTRSYVPLVERRDRLNLYNSTTGAIDVAEVTRVRALVDRQLLELTAEQRTALDRAAGAAAPSTTATRAIASELDLRVAIRHLVLADDADAERAAVHTRAAELGLPALVPDNWAEDGSLRDARAEQRETYNDLYEGLQAALSELLVASGDYWSCWVVDFTDTDVIFTAGGDLYSAPYTVAPGGPIGIGERVKVRPVTEFVTTGRAAPEPQAGTERRDRLARQLRLMAMELEL